MNTVTGRVLKRSIAVWTAWAFVAVSPVLAQATRYGAEPSTPHYYCTDAPYVDLCELTTGWWRMPDHGKPSSLTANGYPNAPGSYQCFVQPLGYPSGNYQFYAEGKFDLSLSGPSYSQWPNKGFVPGTFKQEDVNGVTVTTALVNINFPDIQLGNYDGAVKRTSVLFNLSNVDPAQPPNNFHLIRPDYPAWPNTNVLFGKEYLQALMPFSALRFVDWMWTEDPKQQVTSWATRPKDGNWGDGRRARSYEKMVALCNQLNCDMWINIPLYATPDWDTNMATFIKQNLKPNLHCYYEVGNELWNWGGPAFHPYWQQIEDWANADASVIALRQPPYKLGAWARHGAEMGHQLMIHSANMQPILGSMGRPVLCGQVVVTEYCMGGLTWINVYSGPPANFIWGIAGAPYVGLAQANNKPGSLSEVFQSMTDYLKVVIEPSLQKHAALAKKYGVHFCSYESGQGLPAQQGQFDLMQQAQYDSRMAPIYYQLAAMQQSYGMDLCCFYDFCRPDSKWGFWGALQDIRQIASPPVKYAAQVAISMPTRGLPGGGDGGGSGGGNGGGNGGGFGGGKYRGWPSRGKGGMWMKPGKQIPIKRKFMPINGHPFRTTQAVFNPW